MKRRRRIHEPTPALSWSDRRDFEVERSINGGLGIRPEDWWRFEAERPDLADDAALDVYCHLRQDERPMARAVERLRYLALHHQLTAQEVASVFAGDSPAHQWRAAVLRGVGISRA